MSSQKKQVPKIKTWTAYEIYEIVKQMSSILINGDSSEEFISKEDLKKVLDDFEKEEDNSNHTDDPQVDADISSAVYRTLKELRRRLDLE